MRILFIHTFYTLKGGEDAVFENEMEEMSRQGHAVEALIFSNEKFGVLKLLSLPFNISAYRQTRKTIRSFRPDVVHVHNFHFAASPSVIRAIHKEGVPCVLTLHNFRLICPSATLFHKNKLYLSGLTDKFSWKAIFDGVYKDSVLMTFWLSLSDWLNRKGKTWQLVNRFVIPNDYAKRLFEKSAPEIFLNRISVKTNYLDDPRLSAISRGDHFLFVGRLSEEKGLFTLLEAQRIGKFPLMIIGEGPLQKLVEDRVQEDSRVVHLGFQPKEVVLQEMSRASALVLSSVCMEMNPLSMIEAMSCGTPVIAANVPTLQEFVIDDYNGLQFEANDAIALADSIKRFSSLDSVSKHTIGKNARLTFDSAFTRERHVQSIHAIYAEILTLPQQP